MAPSAAAERELVGRHVELGVVEAFLDGLPDGGASLLLAGEAGIGKTALWRTGLELAHERGTRILSTAVAETESAYTYGGLIDLFADVSDDELAETLDPPLAGALRTALLREHGRARGEQVVAFAAMNAVIGMAADLPVLIAVDDLQWLDQPSARVLAFLSRRVGAAPVGLLATVRSTEEPELDLDRLLTDTNGVRLDVSGLSLAALGRMLELRLGVRPPRSLLARVVRATGGNPFYALELARAAGLDHAAAEPLPVPKKLRELVADRVRRLSGPAAEAVLATYALARPTAATVAEACGSDEGLEEALAVEALERQGGRVMLAHPLVGSIVYSDLSPAARRDLHARLARLPLDDEERVRHLALAAPGPSAEVAVALEQAAGAARARGAPAGAAELLEMAIRLTPPDDPELVLSRTLALARDEYVSGQAARARERCREVEAAAPPGHLRATALWERAQLRDATSLDELEALLDQALAESDGDIALASQIHVAFARLWWWRARPNRAEPHARAALELAEQTGDDGVLAVAIGYEAYLRFIRGRGIDDQAFERALALESGLEDALPVYALPSYWHASAFVIARDDVDLARASVERAREIAAARGAEDALGVIALLHAEFECVAGRWDEAERLAVEASELLERAEVQGVRGYVLAIFAFVDACRGRVERARANGAEALADSQPNVMVYITRVHAVLGLLEVSLGRMAEAAEWLEPLHVVYRDGGFVEPSRYVPDLVEALVALDRLPDAREVLEPFAQASRRLQRQWAVGAAARCRALLLAAEGEHKEALAAAATSVEILRDSGLPLEHGRSLLVRGGIERRCRQKSAAADTLAEALAIFEGLGAPLWAEQARNELGRVGLRPRAPAKLTATERRVAELAAAGHSNDEIAAQAFLSVKTVEANLTRIYRKLGIRSRHQLGERLDG